MPDLTPKPPVLGNPLVGQPAGQPVQPTHPTPAGRPPVNRTKQYILDQIAKRREQADDAMRLKQDAEERLKKTQQESAELQGQVRALEKQIETLRSDTSNASRERDDHRTKLQAVQNLLTLAQKDKEVLEAEVTELRAAMEEIQKALG